MRINAFCIAAPNLAAEHCDELYYCGDSEHFGNTVITYEPFSVGTAAKRIYLPSMTDESDLESFCDHIVSAGATALVRASYDFDEAGLIEARYKLSPIMLLHKMGVLDRCTVVGGVCLDNDDLDLMAQEGVPFVVTPTASAGVASWNKGRYRNVRRQIQRRARSKIRNGNTAAYRQCGNAHRKRRFGRTT